jgi:cytochrome c-type biogenesis protein CcmH/NrfF
VRRAAALLILAGALIGAAPATTLNDVEDELMCDTCNVPLNIAQSPRADQERAEIRRLIAQGKTKQQILGIFKAEYGPNVLADPTGGGSATASWLVPAAAILAALALVALLLPRWRRNRRAMDADEAPAADLSPADADRLDRDLAFYD